MCIYWAYAKGIQFLQRKARRGAEIACGKSRITIRLDDDVLDWFRRQVDEAGGGNYQSLINRALREHIERSLEQLESTLRRVLREELHRGFKSL